LSLSEPYQKIHDNFLQCTVDDPSSAEKGLYKVHMACTVPSLFALTGLSEDQESSEHPYAKYSLPDSKVWALYLEEARAEDKELVQLWNTGVDSLLLFVRVFTPL
jgi:hypothetical protein